MNPDLNIVSAVATGAMIAIAFDVQAVHAHKPAYAVKDLAGNTMHVLAVAILADDQHYALIFPDVVDTTPPMIVPFHDAGFRSTLTAAPCAPAGFVVAGNINIT